MGGFLRRYQQQLLVIALISAYTIFFSYFSILRHHNYYSYRFDLGNMEQTIWNTARGDIFVMTDAEGFGNISRLKYHADFFLILISKIYKFSPKTELLLVLQSLALALGGIPIYLLGKEVLKDKKLAVFPVIFYFLYPALQRSNYFDFHAVKFATTFLLFSFWFLYRRKYLWFVFFSILAISCKEQIPLIIALMSFYGAFRDKKFRIIGVIFGLICLLYFYYVFFKLIPHHQASGKHFVFKHFTEGDLADDFNFKLNSKFLFDKSVWILFFQLFLPLFFIPLLSPLHLLFTVPDIVPKILSNNVYYRSIDFQYTNPTTPFVFIAFIFGFKKYLKVAKKWKVSKLKTLLLPLLISVICLFFWSPFSGKIAGVNAKKILIGREEKDFIDNFKKEIPDSASVCATNNLGSHFSRRWMLYSFPNNAHEADFTLILKGDGNIIDKKTTDEKIKQLLKSKNHKKIAEYKNFIAFKKVTH